jgi:FkbM family methyltransferase
MLFKDVSFTSIDEVLKLYFQEMNGRSVVVILIGANNGEIKDFIGDYLMLKNVSGVLVEPIYEFFCQLEKKFGFKENLSLENSAVYTRNCKKSIYRIETSDQLPSWTRGLGSLKKQTVDMHSHDVREIKEAIVKEMVNCITLKTLLKKYNVEGFHILQIDTEGSDFDIIMSMDLSKNRPHLIIFEYLHLTFYQYYTVLNFFKDNNYDVRKNFQSRDAIAIDINVL